MGFALGLDGQTDEAIVHFEQSLRMSPRDPFNSFFAVGRAVAHYLADQYDQAIKWARHGLELRPAYLGAHRILCASLAQAGQIQEAKATMAALRQMQPNLSIDWVRQSLPHTARRMEKFIEGMRKAGLT